MSSPEQSPPPLAAPSVLALICALVCSLVSAFPAAAQDEAPHSTPTSDALPELEEELDEGWRLTEREAIEAALSGRRALAAARRQLEASQHAQAGAEEFVPWVLDARADYRHEDQPIRDTLSRGLQIRDTFNWSVGVAKAWRYGTELLVTLTNTISRSETPLSFEINGVDVAQRRVTGPYNFSMLTVRVTQHILRGRDVVINSLPELLAQHQVEAAELELEDAEAQIVLSVTLAYWEMKEADSELRLRRRSISHIDAQRVITEALIEAGLVASIELDVIEQQRVAAEEAVLLSRLARTQRELELRQAMGSGTGESERIVPTSPTYVPPARDVDGEDLAAVAEERAMAVQALQTQVAIQALQVRGAQSELEPTLDVFATVSQLGLDDQIGFSDGLMFDAYKQIGLMEFGAVGAGVIFSMPLDALAPQRSVDEAEANKLRLQAQLDEAKARARADVHLLQASITSTRRRLHLLESSVAMAERNLEKGRERYAAGRIATLELLRLQEELEDARRRLTSAQIDLIQLDRRLAYLLGELRAI